MYYNGHVQNGVIVLDDPVVLHEGAKVHVALAERPAATMRNMPLRGTDYVFEDPFSPALDPGDWESAG